MKTYFKIIIAVLSVSVTLTACKKDKDLVPVPPAVVNEQEVITTIKLVMTDSADASAVQTVTFRDPDGEGGNGPDIHDSIKMQAGKTYYVDVILLNELASPVDTISNEVEEEKNDHQLFFVYTGVGITHTYLDADSNVPPLPVGLKTKWKAGAVASGSSRIVLKHQPGIKDGSINTGETDVEVDFVTIIQ